MTNPLPPCPDTPNCYRTSASFDIPAEIVLKAAEKAIREHSSLFSGKAESAVAGDSGVNAVFKIGPYQDDVAVSVEALEDGSTALHIRSASRIGQFDYGVNQRRVKAILKTIDASLAKR